MTADFEFDVSDVMPDMGTTHGAAEAEPLFKSYSEMFEDFSVTFEEVVAAEHDRVVTAVRDGGRIKGSDVGAPRSLALLPLNELPQARAPALTTHQAQLQLRRVNHR